MIAQAVYSQNLLDLAWLLFLLLMFWYFWRGRQLTLKTKSWIKTRGRITRCEWLISGHSMWPKIEYIYQVGETDHTGNYLFLDTVHNEPNSEYARHLAYKVAIAFKENTDIDVYFDPEKPEHAVLDTTVPRKLNLILLFIATLIVLHLAIVVLRVAHLFN